MNLFLIVYYIDATDTYVHCKERTINTNSCNKSVINYLVVKLFLTFFSVNLINTNLCSSKSLNEKKLNYCFMESNVSKMYVDRLEIIANK